MWSNEATARNPELFSYSGCSLTFVSKLKSICLSGSGNKVATTCAKGTGYQVHITDVNTQKEVSLSQKIPSSICRNSYWSRKENLVTCAQGDSAILLWNTETESYTTLRGHKEFIVCIGFSPDDRTLVSGSFDNSVAHWDIESETCLHMYSGHSNMISAVKFHPFDSLIASTSWDKSIAFLDPRTGGEVGRIENAHYNFIKAADFRVDGDLVTGGNDEQIKIWDLRNMCPIDTFLAGGPVGQVICTENSKIVTATNRIIHVRVWDAHTLALDWALDKIPQKKIKSIVVSQNGNTIIIGDDSEIFDIYKYTATRFRKTKSAANTPK